MPFGDSLRQPYFIITGIIGEKTERGCRNEKKQTDDYCIFITGNAALSAGILISNNSLNLNELF